MVEGILGAEQGLYVQGLQEMNMVKNDNGFALILSRGEEVVDALTRFATEEGITSAEVRGIGALTDVEVGYFDLGQKRYERHALEGEYELLSLLGNITLKRGEPLVHAHVILGNRDLSCVGGHLFSAKVAVTAELQIRVLGGQLNREYDEETGLFLISGRD